MLSFILCMAVSVSEIKGPTMSEVAQSAIVEATEYSLPSPTGHLFNDWQNAVLEATADSEEEAACIRERGEFVVQFGEIFCK